MFGIPPFGISSSSRDDEMLMRQNMCTVAPIHHVSTYLRFGFDAELTTETNVALNVCGQNWHMPVRQTFRRFSTSSERIGTISVSNNEGKLADIITVRGAHLTHSNDGLCCFAGCLGQTCHAGGLQPKSSSNSRPPPAGGESAKER